MAEQPRFDLSGCLSWSELLPALLASRAPQTSTHQEPVKGSLLLTDTNKYPLWHRECRKLGFCSPPSPSPSLTIYLRLLPEAEALELCTGPSVQEICQLHSCCSPGIRKHCTCPKSLLRAQPSWMDIQECWCCWTQPQLDLSHWCCRRLKIPTFPFWGRSLLSVIITGSAVPANQGGLGAGRQQNMFLLPGFLQPKPQIITPVYKSPF